MTLTPGVQVGPGGRDHFDDGGLVAEGGVVDGAVAVRVLDLEVGVPAKENPDHLKSGK